MRLVLACLLCGCGAASSDPGRAAWLQIMGAQFAPGELPGPDGGPDVKKLDVGSYRVHPGQRAQPFLGVLAETATGVAIGLVGDRGHWLLPAGVPDTDTPTLPSLLAEPAYAESLPLGNHDVIVEAVDAAGRYGVPVTAQLTVEDEGAPTGHLVVTLRWDRPVDLDLHVVLPTGEEIWSDAVSAGGGRLDLDSNRGCVLDDLGAEHVVFPTSAPAGRYVVRVDTFSMCDDAVAGWSTSGALDGAVIATATGTALPTDVQAPHGRGAGLTVMTFDVP